MITEGSVKLDKAVANAKTLLYEELDEQDQDVSVEHVAVVLVTRTEIDEPHGDGVAEDITTDVVWDDSGKPLEVTVGVLQLAVLQENEDAIKAINDRKAMAG